MGKKEKDEESSRESPHNEPLAELEKCLEENDLTGAWSLIRKLRKEFDDHPLFCFLHGVYHEMRNRLDQAEKWYLTSIELDETADRPYMRLDELYIGVERIDDAIEILRQAIANTAYPVEFFRRLRDVCIEHDHVEHFLEVVEETKKWYRDRGELFYLQGEACFILGLYTTGIDYLRRSLEHGYKGRHTYLYLAEAFSYCSAPEESLHFYRKAVLSNPEDAQVFEWLSKTLIWQQKTGNEQLTAAVGWRSAMLSGGGGVQKIQGNLLGFEDDTHGKVLKAWLDELDESPSRDYEIFCDFYRSLAAYKEDHGSHSFNPVQSLTECIATLQKLDADNIASYFQGWHALLREDYEKAQGLFTMTLRSSSVPDRLKRGAQEGMGLITEKQEMEAEAPPAGGEGRGGTAGLAKYGIDLTASVRQMKHPPMTGLDDVVDRMANILASGPKRSVLLTGPSGVGKTAAISQLAWLITSKACPPELKGFSIFQTSTTSILSGAKYIGQWQQRLEEVCSLGSVSNSVILVFEDIAHLFGAGKTEGSEANFADYLLPRMEQNRVILIGEVGPAQAESLLFAEPRFERLVTEVKMEEPKRNETLAIIRKVADREGGKKNIVFDEEALVEAINLTDTFLPYKAQPGKSVEVVRSVFSMWGADDKKKEQRITPDEVILTFCEATGVPDFIVDRNQQVEMRDMEKFFSDRVLGQEEAIGSLVDAVLQFKSRLSDDRRPIRSFMFVGPTGVGKTESAKVLAEYLFGSPDRIIRLDMSEYNDSYSVTKLIGAHVGAGPRASRFLEKIRREPFSVVLLDEIEKAHTDILNLLLQLLDEGVLTDSEGKAAFFRSSIIILTSNLGSRFYTTQAIGFGTESEIRSARESVLAEVKSFFSPEIFNRLDEVVCFRPLGRDVVETIVNREIGRVLERRGVVEYGLSVEVDPLVLERIIERGYDRTYGARHIKRAVEEAVALPLARLMATTKISTGSMVRVNVRGGKPVADLVTEEGKKELERLGAELPKLSEEDIKIPDRGLRKLVGAMEERIDSLKSKLGYDDLSAERDELEDQMGTPTFWDDPAKANTVLRRYADLGRRIERIHRWEKIFDRIRSVLTLPGKKRTKSDLARAKAQAAGLLKDLESAEMEILLEGKYDFADAFVLLSAEKKNPDAVKWMLELFGVYSKWARRRGYRAHVFGEQTDDGTGKRSLLFTVEGMNAFGLLKNERGIHRKVESVKKKKDIQRISHDCTAVVLADVQPREEDGPRLKIRVRKMSPPKKGLRMKSMSRKVTVEHPTDRSKMEFFTDTTVDRDERLPVDLFLSYHHYRERRKSSGEQENRGVWGSIVRTYETGPRARIVDHSSNIVTQNVKDFLAGKIDSLLIERLI